MKILLAHNDCGSAAPSGENQVFEAERELLRQPGHRTLGGVLGAERDADGAPIRLGQVGDRQIEEYQPGVRLHARAVQEQA